MLSEEILRIPQSVQPSKICTLLKRVAAIRLTRAAHGCQGKLGELVQLQPGTRLECCGDGYNERTIKVYCGGTFYFVFRQDIADAEEHASQQSLTSDR